eukprot:scaffold1615_cov103-Isochrysis_galbana.AAC.5
MCVGLASAASNVAASYALAAPASPPLEAPMPRLATDSPTSRFVFEANDVVDGGEDGVALDAPALAGDVDELAGGEAEVLRYVVGVVGDEVLVEVGVVLLEGLGDDAALELVEGVGAVLGVHG